MDSDGATPPVSQGGSVGTGPEEKDPMLSLETEVSAQPHGQDPGPRVSPQR